MRKKIIFLFFILVSCCFLFGCSSSDMYLYLENTENIEVIQGEKYEPKNVKVYAIHSKNNSKEDITEQAKFSDIDTSTLGEKIVLVTYKREKATYKITVIEPKLIISLEHTKTVYFIGEKFVKEDVFLYDKDGKTKLDSYDVSIVDSKGNAIDEHEPFITIGTYKVKLSSGKLSAEYSIIVSRRAEEGRIDELEGIPSFANPYAIYENELGKISVSGVNTVLESNGVSASYRDNLYSARILMKKEDSKIILEIKEKCGLLLLLEGEDTSISINTKGDIYGNIQSDLSYSYVELNSGNYEITCSNDTYLYSVALVSIENSISNMYVELSIDTKNVQSLYSIGERVDLSGILIYGVKEDGTKVPLSISECYVSIIKNNQEVNSLLVEAGTYKVMISYLEDNIFASYSITVLGNENMTFSSLKLDTLNVQTIFMNREDFNTMGLKVYGIIDTHTQTIIAPIDYKTTLILNNTEVSSFTEDGIYTVRIAYIGGVPCSNPVVSYEVSYFSDATFSKIELDTTGVKKEFVNELVTFEGLKVYGVIDASHRILLNSSDYDISFDNIDTVRIEYKGSIACLNKNASYKISYSSSSAEEPAVLESILIDKKNAKTIFIGEDFNTLGLKVYGIAGNDKYGISSSKYSIKLLDKDNNIVSNFTDNGSYKVVVTYAGTSSCANNEAEYIVEYYQHTYEKVYTRITVDTSNGVCQYNLNDRFTTNGISVLAHYANGASETLLTDDYDIELTFNGNQSTSLSEYGTYVVKVIYTGASTIESASSNYQIRVLAPFATATFSYSGPSVDYVEWIEQIYPNANPKDYIRLPDSSYAFMGFSEDLTTLEPDKSYHIKLYVSKPAANKKRITYLNYNAVYNNIEPTYRDVALNAEVPIDVTPADIAPEGFEFYGYDIPSGAVATENIYYFPLYRYQGVEEVVPTIRINSSSSANIILSYKNGTLYSSEVKVESDNGNIYLRERMTELTELSNNINYRITGSFISKNGYLLYSVNIMDTVFTTSVYSSLEQIDTTDSLNIVTGNSFSLDITEFIEHAPLNYTLSGFLVCDEQGNEIEDVPYVLDSNDLYVTGLENNTAYQVVAYYDYMPRIRMAKASNGLTYRFHFVGFFVQTKGDVTCRVRMMYEDNVLYTWYVAKGDDLINPYSFTLPEEYKDYRMVGSLENLNSIQKDVDCDVLLVPSSEENTYTVIFYEHYNNGYYPILSVQSVSEFSSAVAPKNPDPYYSKDKAYRYVFSGWSEDFSSITETTYIYAQYTRYVIVPPKQNLNSIEVFSDFLIVNYSIVYADSVRNINIYVLDNNSHRLDANIEGIHSNQSISIDGILPNMDYTLYYEIEYELMDDKGPKTLILTSSFKTLEANASLDINIAFTDIRYNYAKANITGTNQVDRIYYLDGIWSSSYVQSRNDTRYASITLDYQNKEYNVWYATKDSQNDNIYYVYNNMAGFTFKTLPAEKPDIKGFISKEHKKNIEQKMLILDGSNPDDILIEVTAVYRNMDFIEGGNNADLVRWEFGYILYYDEIDNLYKTNFNGVYAAIPAYDVEGNISDYYQCILECLVVRYFYDGEYYEYFLYEYNLVEDATDYLEFYLPMDMEPISYKKG